MLRKETATAQLRFCPSTQKLDKRQICAGIGSELTVSFSEPSLYLCFQSTPSSNYSNRRRLQEVKGKKMCFFGSLFFVLRKRLTRML